MASDAKTPTRYPNMPESYQGASPNARLLAGAIPTVRRKKPRASATRSAFPRSPTPSSRCSCSSSSACRLRRLPPIPETSVPQGLSGPRRRARAAVAAVAATNTGTAAQGGASGQRQDHGSGREATEDEGAGTAQAGTVQQMNIPAQPVASGVQELPGAVTSAISPTLSLGAGTAGAPAPARARAAAAARVPASAPAPAAVSAAARIARATASRCRR